MLYERILLASTLSLILTHSQPHPGKGRALAVGVVYQRSVFVVVLRGVVYTLYGRAGRRNRIN